MASSLPALRLAGLSPGLSAVLSDFTLADHALALGDFCERRNLAYEGYDDAARRRPGNGVRSTIETEGYKGQKLPILWSMYDAAQQRIVTEPTLRYQAGWPDGFYIPAADEDRNDGELWVPLPPTPGEYFVRVEIQSPDWEISTPRIRNRLQSGSDVTARERNEDGTTCVPHGVHRSHPTRHERERRVDNGAGLDCSE